MTSKSKLISRRDCLKVIGIATSMPIVGRAAQASEADKAVNHKPVHRILTCNILLDLPEHKGTPVDWDTQRRDLCLKVIKSRNPDILCLQEVGRKQNTDFIKAFPELEAFGYPDPYVDTNPPRFQAIKNVIMYSKSRYEMTSAGTYWLSETPIVAGSRLPDVGLPRHVTWLRLKDRATGKEFRVLNTHWALKQPYRLEESKIILKETSPYKPEFPQLLCGDLNSTVTSPEHQLLADAAWKNTYKIAQKDAQPTFTGHGFKIEKAAKRNHGQIDFILYHGDVKPIKAQIIRDHEGGLYPSDHYFVSADIQL